MLIDAINIPISWRSNFLSVEMHGVQISIHLQKARNNGPVACWKL